MKNLFFVVFILCFSFVSSAPEIILQKQSYQPGETIIGQINSLTEISKSDLKIFEDRREVNFEKGVFYYNQTNYFYIIISKEGSFNISVSNLLYKENNIPLSINLNKVVQIKISNLSNETEIISLIPGIYKGTTPKIVVTNMGEKNATISYLNFTADLQSGKSKTIYFVPEKEFSFLEISSYEKFSIPVFYTNFSSSTFENETNSSQNSSENQEEKIYSILVPENLTITKISNKTTEIFFEIKNEGSAIENLVLSSDFEALTISPETISLDENQLVNVSVKLNEIAVGFFPKEISFFVGDKKIGSTKIEIFSFASQEASNEFNSESQQQTCAELQLFSCEQNQYCVGEYSYSQKEGKVCCETECKSSPEEQPKSNTKSILFGIGGLLLICLIVFVVYKRNKKIKDKKPEDKFKEIEKKFSTKNIK